MANFDNLVNQAQLLFGGDPFSRVTGVRQGTSLEILEVRDDGSAGESVTLQGRAMPYQGVEWEVTQQVETTWYPGNPVATQQVLGPREQPTTFKGMWKDRFIRGSVISRTAPANLAAVTLAGTELQLATEVVQLFHRLARSGKLWRVTWLDEVRLGIITRFTPKYDRATDVEWELEFAWQSRDDIGQVRTASAPQTPDRGLDLFGSIQDAIATIDGVSRLARNFTAAIVSTIDEIGDLIFGFVELLEVANTLVNLPAQLVGAIQNTADQIVRRVQDLVRQLGFQRASAQPVGPFITGPTVDPTSRAASTTGSASASGAAVQGSAVLNTVKYEQTRRATVRAATDLAAFAQDENARIQSRVNPEADRFIDVPENANLYTLSRQFYGSPDFASYLATVNKLGTANVAPGTRLRIPPRPQGAALRPEPTSATDGGVCRA